jgi:hypothetical protein
MRFIELFQRGTIEYRSLCVKAGDVQRLGIDEVSELARRAGVPMFDELSTLQRQQIALRELKKDVKDRFDDVMSLLCEFFYRFCGVVLKNFWLSN